MRVSVFDLIPAGFRGSNLLLEASFQPLKFTDSFENSLIRLHCLAGVSTMLETPGGLRLLHKLPRKR